jgi:hypothetical protein
MYNANNMLIQKQTNSIKFAVHKDFCLFVCLQPHEQFFCNRAAIIITGDRDAII